MSASLNPTARYCRSCGARVTDDVSERECAPCSERTARLAGGPPAVPAEFWANDRMRDALASWHMGRVIAAFRIHPFHERPLSQELVGGWVGLTQAQLSRIENGPPIRDLGRLSMWVRTLHIPAPLLWFKVGPRSQQIDEVNGPDRHRGLEADPPIGVGSGAGAVGAGERPVPRMLPAAIPDFTGREEQVAGLAAALSLDGQARWVLVCGPAGSGKTALTVRAAHEVAEAFADGQLFVQVREPSGAAVPAETTLAVLLRALGYRGWQSRSGLTSGLRSTGRRWWAGSC